MIETTESLQNCLQQHIQRTTEVLQRVDCVAVGKMVERLYEAFHEGRRVFIFGNGGSAATASHLQEDLAKSSLKDLSGSQRLRVQSLSDSVPFITALGNDCGYDSVFREQLITHGSSGDIAVAISGSGNSPNVVSAVKWAKENGLFTCGLTGFNGGKLKSMVDLSLHCPVLDMEVAENAHMVITHLLVGGLRFRLSDEVPA